ncbi:MAG: tetraacyldisaccharide 4'-kinase [Candidatus Omnitrophica bacterium]|nr:tetraacyldisaccharide 4'-kinase [Candidatus Omnitrophota bacterium]
MKRYLYTLVNGQRRDIFALAITTIFIPFSWIYRFIVVFLRAAYARSIIFSKRVSVPVISIGNLTMGGSGKTPTAIFITKMLLAKKRKPAIILRGYKSGSGFSNDSDEQMMMAQTLPDVTVMANPDRYQAATEIIKHGQADVIILDDGFQHWRLQRNLDIVLVDCVNPFGNGQVIPAGILREPVSALHKADIIMLTKSDLGNTADIRKRIARSFPDALLVETIHSPKSVTDIYSNQSCDLRRVISPVIAFCAIGDPVSFKSTLLSLGADIKEFVPFLDHHEYDVKDMQRIKDLCQAIGITTVITTAKDAVKLKNFGELWSGITVYKLNIEIQVVKGYQEFSQRIAHVLGG